MSGETIEARTVNQFDSGARSLFYAESIASRRVVGFGVVEVSAVREATLTFDLSAIEGRCLRAIRVSIGFDTTDLSRGTAYALRDCLSAALEATKKDVTR